MLGPRQQRPPNNAAPRFFDDRHNGIRKTFGCQGHKLFRFKHLGADRTPKQLVNTAVGNARPLRADLFEEVDSDFRGLRLLWHRGETRVRALAVVITAVPAQYAALCICDHASALWANAGLRASGRRGGIIHRPRRGTLSLAIFGNFRQADIGECRAAATRRIVEQRRRTLLAKFTSRPADRQLQLLRCRYVSR